MVYPVFEYESIKARCEQDISAFKENMQVKDPINHTLYCPDQDIKDLNSLKIGIKPIIDYLNANLKYKNTNLTLRFIDQISYIEQPLQYHLWIARTYLFYQLLIYATATFLNKDLYNNIKNKLQQKILTAPLFNTINNTKNIENAFIEMYKMYQKGEDFKDFKIN